MLNSRDISLLRADVAANCKIFVELCKKAGLPVLIVNTVRDKEYQEECFKKGTAKTKVPSFHSVSAGLAFDICKNIKGQEYSDNVFFIKCAAIAKKMGFEWGGDWSSFPDSPHFQWSGPEHQFTSKMVIAGKLPPMMPLYEEEDELSEILTQIANVAGLSEKDTITAIGTLAKFANTEESSWEKDGVKALVDMGLITTTRDGRELVEMGELGTILKRFKEKHLS